jgi:Fe-S cluster assembly iron-binding protein IscA
MLAVTDRAASAVSTLVDSADLPDNAGLRFQRGTDAEGNAAIGVSMVSEPEADDQAVPAGSSSVYLAPEVSGMLDDQVLDAETSADGVAFTIRPQEGSEPQAGAEG